MISFENFKQIIVEAERYQKLSDKTYNETNGGVDLFKVYGAENGNYTPECFMICMLEKIMNDSNGVIGAWSFECNFGEDSLELEDATISTIEDLYKYIIK